MCEGEWGKCKAIWVLGVEMNQSFYHLPFSCVPEMDTLGVSHFTDVIQSPYSRKKTAEVLEQSDHQRERAIHLFSSAYLTQSCGNKEFLVNTLSSCFESKAHIKHDQCLIYEHKWRIQLKNKVFTLLLLILISGNFRLVNIICPFCVSCMYLLDNIPHIPCKIPLS